MNRKARFLLGNILLCLSVLPGEALELSVVTLRPLDVIVGIVNSNHQENELNNILHVPCYDKNVSLYSFYTGRFSSLSSTHIPSVRKNKEKQLSPAETALS